MRLVRPLLFVVILLTGLLTGMPLQGQHGPGLTVVKAGLLIDGTGSPPRADVLIWFQGNTITRIGPLETIPPEAVVVDASEQVVIPGLIDTHVHLGEQAILRQPSLYQEQVRLHLRQNLALGVTTVFSLGLDRNYIFPLRDSSWDDDFSGARILTAGTGFAAVGGHPTQFGLAGLNEIDDPAQAREQVRKLADQRVDGIKIWFARIPGRSDLPVFKAEVARAIIDEAHRHAIQVMAHINLAEDTKTLVRAQLDGITHIARDPYDEETISLMANQGTIVAPTLVQRRKALIFKEDEGLLKDPLVR
ncbi:MAG: amidohydrolase family protein, partial [Acidobacteriota bacterium]